MADTPYTVAELYHVVAVVCAVSSTTQVGIPTTAATFTARQASAIAASWLARMAGVTLSTTSS